MTQPQTGWEVTGERTTTEEEREFLEQIDSETDATLASAGLSVQGRDIWRVDIGNPEGATIFVAAAQHGTEYAGREGALIFLREVAYSTDTDVGDFLAENRIVIMPNVNPDGLHHRQRRNMRGVDLNRGWAAIAEPEQKAVRRVTTDVRPHMLLDLHEWGTDRDFVFSYMGAGTEDYPGHPDILAQTHDLVDYTVSGVEDAGYTTYPYPGWSSVGYSYLSSSSIPWHSVGYLTETRSRAEFPDRVDAQRVFLHLCVDWYTQNKGAVDAAVQSSLNDSLSGSSPLMIPMEVDGERGPWTEIEDPGEYVIPAGVEIPSEVLEINGIEIDGRTISTQQRYRGLIAPLFDPQSFDRIRLSPPRTAGDRSLGIALVDGIRYPIKGVVAKRDGIRHPVKGAVHKREGVRQLSPIG